VAHSLPPKPTVQLPPVEAPSDKDDTGIGNPANPDDETILRQRLQRGDAEEGPHDGEAGQLNPENPGPASTFGAPVPAEEHERRQEPELQRKCRCSHGQRHSDQGQP